MGVNLLFAIPGGVGGSEQYLARQLVGLLERGDVDLVLYVLPGFAAAHPELAAARMVTVPVSGHRRAVRVAAEATWLAARAHRDRVDVLHHGGGTLPMTLPGLGRLARIPPTVLTVHDVQYLTYPDTFSALKLRYLRASVPRSVGQAAMVTVPSGYVGRTLQEAFAIAPERVVVVPHPLPEAEATVRTSESELRQRYGLPGPVVLYPAITYTHKNHSLLLRALVPLVASRPDLRLVLVGGVGPAEPEVFHEIEQLGLSGAVVRPGRVSDADRNGLLALAAVCAFPSRYEGFGAPVLEAMAAGCPVIAADTTALPEVVGDAGLLLSPDDAGLWSATLARWLDEAERARWSAAGRERARSFTPAIAAEALHRAYLLALS
ncbi:MAG: putative glycosyltransferase [Acidimicrobiia bacterium]|nr:putative glycosyltransferase [Acidimicrobiia bacterium]